jgi:hypothetical protein
MAVAFYILHRFFDRYAANDLLILPCRMSADELIEMARLAPGFLVRQ